MLNYQKVKCEFCFFFERGVAFCVATLALDQHKSVFPMGSVIMDDTLLVHLVELEWTGPGQIITNPMQELVSIRRKSVCFNWLFDLTENSKSR